MADDSARPLLETEQALVELRREFDDKIATAIDRAGRLPVGTVIPALAGEDPPRTLLLNGQTPLRATYPALWQWAQAKGLVGTWFSTGNGTTTFGLPSLVGQVLMGAGNGSGSNTASGDVVGVASKSLLLANMPSHSHANHQHSFGGHGGHFPGTSFLAASGSALGLAAWNSGGTFGGGGLVDFSGLPAEGSGTAIDMRQVSRASHFVIWT